jgi:hypothetical protein
MEYWESIINRTFNSKKDGEFKVLKLKEVLNYEKSKCYKYTIEFLETGYIVDVNMSSIYSGQIKDYLKPNSIHKGFLGGKKYRSTHFLYKRWKSMMERCYREKNKDYKSYGAKGVTVDIRWHNFQNYVEDVSNIEGFDKEKIINNQIELDKDIKIKNNKIYSLITCIWVDKLKNNKHHAINQFQNHIIIDTVENNIYYIDNMKQFCKENDFIKIDSIREPRKTKSLYKKRWYILYEEDYNNNKEFYDSFIKVS